MPDFVPNGPDIPFEILEAHQEERLVFFCGAGISMYAGLPGFVGLVDYAYDFCGMSSEKPTNEALDRSLLFLENEAAPNQMRKGVIQRLCKYMEPAELATHSAILSLARGGEEGVRLVTTNFDTFFEQASDISLHRHSASALPTPHKDRWESLVYLHGRLSAKYDPKGKSLVLTSSDFGRAYLSEAWAARFVVELFREFTVLFVGYSLTDPVMSYLVDALSSQSGTKFNAPYILAGYDDIDATYQSVVQDWERRKIRAIPYRISSDDPYPHYMLHETLRNWAFEHRLGLTGRKSMAINETDSPYSGDTRRAKSILWALRDVPVAKAFAESDIPPDISWLRGLEAAENEVELPEAEKIVIAPLFETTQRKTLDGPAQQISNWLLRKLETKELCDWVAGKGGAIHQDFIDRIAHYLHDNEIIEPYKRFWQLICGRELLRGIPTRSINYLFMLDKIKAESIMDPLVAVSFFDMITPCLTVRASSADAYRRLSTETVEAAPKSLYELGDFKPTVQYPDLFDFVEIEQISSQFLQSHAHAVTAILERAVMLGKIAELDRHLVRGGFSRLSSISPHSQNDHLKEWDKLALLCRDSFDALFGGSKKRARTLLAHWLEVWENADSSIFARLCLYATAKDKRIGLSKIIALLGADISTNIWDSSLTRELSQFLRHRGKDLSHHQLNKLLNFLLTPPSRDRFSSDISDEDFQRITEGWASQYLSKLLQGGVSRKVLVAIDKRVDNYTLSSKPVSEDRDEFNTWSSSAEFIKPYSAKDLTSLSAEELADRLVHPTHDKTDLFFSEDTYRRDMSISFGKDISISKLVQIASLLPTHLSSLCSYFFSGLSRSDDPERHMAAVEAFSSSAILSKVIEENPERVARWLEKLSNVVKGLEASNVFWDMWDRVWDAAKNREDGHNFDLDPLGVAINTLGGTLSEILIHQASDSDLQKGAGFPDHIVARLTKVGDGESASSHHALAVLATRLQWLHAVDPDWARGTLITRMAPDNPLSVALWRCFLFNLRVSKTLVDDLQPYLYEVFMNGERYNERRLYSLLTIVAVYSQSVLTENQYMEILFQANTDMLSEAIRHLKRILQGSTNDPELLWDETIAPWINRCWPKARVKIDENTIKAFADLLVSTKGKFPSAYKLLVEAGLLGEIEDKHTGIVYRLKNPIDGYDYPKLHPNETLSLLITIINPGKDFYQDQRYGLKEVLDIIQAADPTLKNDPRMIKLRG